MKREISTHAHVAKLCRAYLKQKSIQGRVRSESYTGGNSVTVQIQDQSPAIFDELKSALSKYQQGHFDGMTDHYECNNKNESMPQVKYLFVETGYSDEIKQAAWDFLRKYVAGADEFPAKLSDIPGSARIWNDWVPNVVLRLLSGSYDGLAEKFWNERVAGG